MVKYTKKKSVFYYLPFALSIPVIFIDIIRYMYMYQKRAPSLISAITSVVMASSFLRIQYQSSLCSQSQVWLFEDRGSY